MSYQDYCNGYDRKTVTAHPNRDYTNGVHHHNEGRVKWTVSEFKSEHTQPASSSGAKREKLQTLPYDLVPFQEITDAFVRVAEHGVKKYKPWNWTLGLSRVQLCCSLLRHVFAYIRGENHDPDSGLSHTDHILWNAVALSHNVHHDLEDGRRPEPAREYKK